MTEGFLNRWLRLKQEAKVAPEDPDAHPESQNVALNEEELAALPRPEDLTADSDVSCFLKPGVPAGMRNAALRRIWLLDPAIRDFEGPARDYAYDWNQAGGVPGSGLLDARDDVAAMLRGLFGDPEPMSDTPAAQPVMPDDEIATPGKSPSV